MSQRPDMKRSVSSRSLAAEVQYAADAAAFRSASALHAATCRAPMAVPTAAVSSAPSMAPSANFLMRPILTRPVGGRQ